MASCLVVLVMAALGASSGSPSDVGVGGVAGPSGLFNVRPLSVFTGHCNASIARGAAVWKPAPGVVDVFFPKVVRDATFL